MKIGLRSLLFGAHQFIYHPILVYLAWKKLFGRPNFKECICILVHDLGYWNCKFIEGFDGENHSELGAKIVYYLFGSRYRDLVLYHSRTYAAKDIVAPSKLCYADKYSMKFENMFFYLLRTKFTGELIEYRRKFFTKGTDEDWFKEQRQNTINFALKYTQLTIQCYEDYNKICSIEGQDPFIKKAVNIMEDLDNLEKQLNKDFDKLDNLINELIKRGV